MRTLSHFSDSAGEPPTDVPGGQDPRADSTKTTRIVPRLRQEAARVERELRARAEEGEQALRESEERFRTFVRESPDGIIIIDSEGRIVEWNDGEERITGIPRADAMFQPLWDIQYRLAPDEVRTDAFLRLARETILNGFKEGRSLRRVLEDEIQRPDGSRRILQSVLLAMESGGKLLAGGISRDITDRKRAVEALNEVNAQLAEADRRKNEFLTMLAHELRNPLAVISSANHILRIRGAGDSTTNRACEAIECQVGHMARLVDDLFDVSRVAQGKIALKRETLSLSSVVDSAIEAARSQIDGKGHTLFVSLPREPLFLDGDHVRLTQVLSNVLTNAAKFTPTGGEIHLSADRENDLVVVKVRDNGHGIAAELLPHVFEPFVQADPLPDRSRGGLGIGLTIVRALVEMHGGRVEAHSRGQGQGSEFRFWLPVAGSR